MKKLIEELADAARHAYSMGIPTSDGFQNIALAVAKLCFEKSANILHDRGGSGPYSESSHREFVRGYEKACNDMEYHIRHLAAKLGKR